ncbi:hypothetical protein PAXRUDRAFT_157951 [Paxillus rubicundulus Ve08.2h10]|uniref:Uncharacterized protein n=1 Tax=Paxillus rubicundulus Ve08.2h10 TaxID=930991 RepID=A0A0D0DPA0_9AGAM|nr:hypothetical protein PAXRUDRAFT_157951 [Paxillus rubicundulus Ve08.2h10]
MAQSEADPANAKAQWNSGEVTALIDYLYDHCVQCANSGNFRMATYKHGCDCNQQGSQRWP